MHFINGFGEVPMADLLPAYELESMAKRFEERDIEFEMEPGLLSTRDAELEPEFSD